MQDLLIVSIIINLILIILTGIVILVCMESYNDKL